MKSFYKHNKPEAKNIENNNNNKDSSIAQQNQSEEYNNNNYSLILNLIKELKNEFCDPKFATLIKLIDNSNYNTNINLINDLEYILFSNFFTTEIINKVDVIRIISDQVITESIDFNDKKWFEILKDFLNQRKINIVVYYRYLEVFENLSKYINSKNEKNSYFFYFKYYKFILEENTAYFNNYVKINSLNDINYLLNIINLNVLKIDLIADNIWFDVDAVVLNFKDNIPIKFYNIMPFLILDYEKHIKLSKSSILFKNSIKALNKNLITMIKDYRLLEEYDKKGIKNYFYDIIMYADLYFENDNDFNNLFSLLKDAYLKELSSDIKNTEWFNHIVILIKIIDYKKINVFESKEFWDQFFFYFKLFFKNSTLLSL